MKKGRVNAEYDQQYTLENRTFPTKKAALLVLILVIQIGFIVAAFHYEPKPQDIIREYEITVTPQEDGSLDILYRFVWEPLDAWEDLTWVEIGMANGNFSVYKRNYNRLADRFELLASRNDCNTLINTFYAALCRCLALKWNLGIRAADAYKSGNKVALQNIAESTIPCLVDLLDKARVARRAVWMYESKLEGFEIIDGRFGSAMMRCRTLADLINMYLEGEIEKIEPLEKERLHHKGENCIFRMVSYSQIFSAGCSW